MDRNDRCSFGRLSSKVRNYGNGRRCNTPYRSAVQSQHAPRRDCGLGLRMHIVFSIVAEGKLAFPIVKCFAADVSGQRVAVPLLNGVQNRSGFPQWRLGEGTRGRIVGERHVARENEAEPEDEVACIRGIEGSACPPTDGPAQLSPAPNMRTAATAHQRSRMNSSMYKQQERPKRWDGTMQGLERARFRRNPVLQRRSDFIAAMRGLC